MVRVGIVAVPETLKLPVIAAPSATLRDCRSEVPVTRRVVEIRSCAPRAAKPAELPMTAPLLPVGGL